MSWLKKSSGGIFTPEELADFLSIAELNPNVMQSDGKQEAKITLYTPANSLITEGKSVILSHVSRISGIPSRYIGDKKLVKKLNDQSSMDEYLDAVSSGLRSTRHNVDSLRERIESKGLSWEEAKQRLEERSLFDSSGHVRPMDYYVSPDEKRFADYNWKLFAEALKSLESALFSGNSTLESLVYYMDRAVNSVHNTTIEPVDFVYSKVFDEPSTGKRGFGESILSKFKHGEQLFAMLEGRNSGASYASIASPEVKKLYKLYSSFNSPQAQ